MGEEREEREEKEEEKEEKEEKEAIHMRVYKDLGGKRTVSPSLGRGKGQEGSE